VGIPVLLEDCSMASVERVEAPAPEQTESAAPEDALVAAPLAGAGFSLASLVSLQRSAGNSAVTAMLGHGPPAAFQPAGGPGSSAPDSSVYAALAAAAARRAPNSPRRLSRQLAEEEIDDDESDLGVLYQDEIEPGSTDEAELMAEQRQDAEIEFKKAEDKDAAAGDPLPDLQPPENSIEADKDQDKDAAVLEMEEAQEGALPPEVEESEEPPLPGEPGPEPAAPPAPAPGSAAQAGGQTGGAGRPLSPAVRGEMEHALSADFSGVRLHTGGGALAAAARMGAAAFTDGQNISFGRGVDDPEAPAHRGLLRHELEHVAERARGVTGPDEISSGQAAAAGLSSGAGIQTAPTVTAVAAGAEVGVGKTMDVTATAAGKGALTWTLTGAPAGVTIVPTGKRTARVKAAATSLPGAGTAFTVQAALASNAGDNASAPTATTLVGVTSATFNPNPAFPASIAALIPSGGPANTADPNRDGVTGNTANVVAVTAPAGRPVTVDLPTPMGATAAGTAITPGATTGRLKVRVRDNATSSTLDTNMFINPVPLKLSGFGPQAAAAAGPYGPSNPLIWKASDTASTLDRQVGETITAGGRDDFGIPVNAGFNPSPLLNLTVPANVWADQLVTPPGHPGADINRFVGPGAPKSLPGVWILRQGFHWLSWNGASWSGEFDNGIHRRSLVKAGAGFGFRTEHVFPGASSPIWPDAYAGPPLIALSGLAGTPLAPTAVGIAADGVATANLNVVSSVAGRSVNWTMVNGSAAITAGAAAQPVGTPATMISGQVAGKVRVKAADTVFPNRVVEGNVPLLAVRLGSVVVPVKSVPAGTLVAVVNLDAAPGGRTLNAPVLDGAAAAGGVTAAVTAPAGANAAARTITLTRPAGFTGTVTVSVSDSVLPAQRAAAKVRFK
jgi:hypothetical protein